MCNFAIESAQSLRMQGKDLTKGNLMTVMMEFSIPYLCACFLQLLYSMADLYFVGKFCDVLTSTATTPIFFTTFKNEVRKFCRKRLAVKQCFALAQSYEKHTAGLP